LVPVVARDLGDEALELRHVAVHGLPELRIPR
jgi:hypothetical protein